MLLRIEAPNAPLHVRPESAAEVVGTLTKGTVVPETRRRQVGDGTWRHVRTPDGKGGWIAPDESIHEIPLRVTAVNGIELHEEPTGVSPTVRRLKRDVRLHVLDTVDGPAGRWWKVQMEVSGRTGFVSGDARLDDSAATAFGRRRVLVYVRGAAFFVLGSLGALWTLVGLSEGLIDWLALTALVTGALGFGLPFLVRLDSFTRGAKPSKD